MALKKPTAKQAGLKKLPTTVRNKMGYMNKGGTVKKTKYMSKGGMKKTKYMAKGGMKKTKYMAKGGMKKTKYMAKGGAARRK
jgi:hypothetical protein